MAIVKFAAMIPMSIVDIRHGTLTVDVQFSSSLFQGGAYRTHTETGLMACDEHCATAILWSSRDPDAVRPIGLYTLTEQVLMTGSTKTEHTMVYSSRYLPSAYSSLGLLVCLHASTYTMHACRDGPETETSPSLDHLENYLWSCLGLQNWRLGLDLSGLEPITMSY